MVDRAASLAFFGILSLFPAMLLAVAGAGLIGSDDIGRDVASYAEERGLSDALSGALRSVLETADQATFAGVGTAGVVGLAASIYGASRAFTAAGRALDAVAGATLQSRSPSKRAKDIGWTMVIVVLGVISLSLLAVTGRVLRDLLGLIGLSSAVASAWIVGRWVVAAAIALAIVAVVRRTAPTSRPAGAGALTAGSLVTVGTWLAASGGYAFYVAELATYNATYGAFAGAVILLLWIWLGAIAFLYGAELDAVLEGRRSAPADR